MSVRKISSERGEVKIHKTYHPIQVTRVYANSYQKQGTMTAELKQTVETLSQYPQKSVSDTLKDNVFDTKEFGFGTTDYTNTQVRVAWMDVPVGVTEEQVAKKLEEVAPDRVLMQILSNHPILSDKQIYAIENGITTKDVIAESQVMRFPEGSENAGKLILDKLGRPIYRGNYFRKEYSADEDRRSEDPSDFFVTEALKAEMLEGVTSTSSNVSDQTVY